MVAVQVREVPDEVRRTLAAEAERRGQSLQVYLLDVLERAAADTHNRQLLRIHKPIRPRGELMVDPMELIRRVRENQDHKTLTSLVGENEAGRIVEGDR